MSQSIDINAFIADIYENYHAVLFKSALKRTENEQDAHDIVSDVFVIAILKAEILMTHPNKLAWLFQVMSIIIKKRWYSNSYRDVKANESGERNETYIKVEVIPIGHINEAIIGEPFYFGELFDQYNDILTKNEIEFLIYRYEHRLGIHEISKKLGKTVSGTTSYGERIRKKIKKFLMMRDK